MPSTCITVAEVVADPRETIKAVELAILKLCEDIAACPDRDNEIAVYYAADLMLSCRRLERALRRDNPEELNELRVKVAALSSGVEAVP